MRTQFPKAYEYFAQFKDQLLARKTAPLRQQMARGPFYPVLGVGPYTFAKWKVIFKDLTELFQCCVIGPNDSSMAEKPVLADYTLRIIPAQSEHEAHFIAALLNSAPCAGALYYSSAGVQTQRYHAGDAEKVAIGQFSGTKQQVELAELSLECHVAAKKDDSKSIRRIEGRIDKRAADYWKIASSDLREIQECLARVESPSYAPNLEYEDN
jgi:hypothetical protein